MHRLFLDANVLVSAAHKETSRVRRLWELPDVFLCTSTADATHLLTGDLRHFGPYLGREVSGVMVLEPAAYLATRARSGDREQGTEFEQDRQDKTG